MKTLWEAFFGLHEVETNKATPIHGGPNAQPIGAWFWYFLGCFLCKRYSDFSIVPAIVAIGTLNDYALQLVDFSIFYASLGAFAVLLFGMPGSPAL